MAAYYNEIDKSSIEKLKYLISNDFIADGEIDERSIEEVKSYEIKGFSQCHFFAGIGGWSLALRYAGWPDDRPVWTGSCPCQPFSSIGKATRQQDERHLWPAWYRLIRESNPPEIFGEQVDEAIACGWADEVFLDLEKKDYACASAILPAYSVASDHERYRLYFFANSSQKSGIHKSECEESKGRLHNYKINGSASSWDEAESKVFSIYDGLPSFVGESEGFGNAIHAKVAAKFIISCNEARMEVAA